MCAVCYHAHADLEGSQRHDFLNAENDLMLIYRSQTCVELRHVYSIGSPFCGNGVCMLSASRCALGDANNETFCDWTMCAVAHDAQVNPES